MGVDLPVGPGAPEATAEALLSSFSDIAASERRRHATVFNYWLSIRGELHFPLIQDLDPLELSDAAPCSVLLELIGSGEDAEIRHLGEGLAIGAQADRASQAPRPSLLSCIASRLAAVASSRRPLSFEEEFETADGRTRCWVTLLPFSSTGTWVDYVYAFASSATVQNQVEDVPQPPFADAAACAAEVARLDETTERTTNSALAEELSAGVRGEELGPEFKAQDAASEEPAVACAGPERAPSSNRALPAKLTSVRGRAEEARMAKLRSDAALCEALSAAYDFALDAENEAEAYLQLVEEQGLKIQLRSPMTPVATLAFAGCCEKELIARFEAVLAWALKADLPRGSLPAHIEAEGGLAPILAGQKQLQ